MSLGALGRRLYVALMRTLRRPAAGLGLLGWLERRGRRSRLALWLRSLLAIHDLDDMRALRLPWWTFRAQELVGAFLEARPGARVLEYGSGASTLWLADRAGEVHSVEHDPAAVSVLDPILEATPGVTLHAVPPASGRGPVQSARRGWTGRDFSAYVGTVARIGGSFDLLIVDGRCRLACLAAALPHLAEDGLILFDNHRRARYRAGLAELIATHRLARLDTRGLTTSLPYPDATLLLARDPALLAGLEAVAGR